MEILKKIKKNKEKNYKKYKKNKEEMKNLKKKIVEMTNYNVGAKKILNIRPIHGICINSH